MANNLERFDHVVVLMLENRSFDNMLGLISDAPNYDGVVGKKLSNPPPVSFDGTPVNGADQGPVFVSPGEIMDNPNPDPGEYFPHVNTQLYNVVSPTSNAYQASYKKFQSPYNQPPPPLPTPGMQGFVQDYYDNFAATQGRRPTRGEYSVIMNSFPTSVIPVMTGLVEGFAVCDQWHCAVPSQTFCNRSFFHAATSNGQVVNAPFEKWPLKNDHETLFNRLEDAGISWAIYFDEEDVLPLTLIIHFPKLWEFIATRFHHMDRFREDAANGTLPQYSFIEPRLFLNHNDQHPPIQIDGWTQPSTVTAGEELIHQIYDAIRNSPPDGPSHPANTLLMITYDEHGGCFDHVPPPCATPPGVPPGPGEMQFAFDRLGVRVPAVFVSAWTSPFNVVNTPLQHTSMLATLEKKWRLEPLTQRDTSAPLIDFDKIFDLSSARDPKTSWPVLTPLPQPAEADATSNLHHPLNELQKAIVGAVAGLDKAPAHPKPIDQWSIAEALLYMRKVRTQLEAL